MIQRSTHSLVRQPIAVRISGDPVAANNGIFYFHTDHLGSTSVMTKHSDGYIVTGSMARYTPFGDWRTEPSADLTDRGFTGHKSNNTGSNDLGLIYMNARWYSPAVSRFLSADTIVPDSMNPQGLNRYSYVLNSPINAIDPNGHDPHWCNRDPACISSYGYVGATNSAYQTEMQDPGYGQNINAYDDHPWSEQYYRNIADGVLTVPDGLSVAGYVGQLVAKDVLSYAQNGDDYGGYHKAMALIGGAEAAELFYTMLYATDGDAAQAYVYAHAEGDLLDELPNGNSSFVDGMDGEDAIRYQKYWEAHAPETSTPYNTIRRYTEAGEIKQVTTYDGFGDRYAQYDLIDPRRGEHMHTFEYNEIYRRPKGLRSGHLPLD